MHGTISNSASRLVQERASTSPKNSFANETAVQKAQHREIALRDRRKKRRGPVPFAYLRKHELELIFADRWGSTLPDDDAGRADLRLLADHLLQIGPHVFDPWARVWAPWANDVELDVLIDQVGTGKNWKADALAKELNLDDAMRTRLRIKTIGAVDSSKAQRARRCKKQEAAAARARRAKAGAVPQALSEARLKPWLALGISESTHHRRRRKADSLDSNSSGILLEYLLPTKHCQDRHGGPKARAAEPQGVTTKPIFRVSEPGISIDLIAVQAIEIAADNKPLAASFSNIGASPA